MSGRILKIKKKQSTRSADASLLAEGEPLFRQEFAGVSQREGRFPPDLPASKDNGASVADAERTRMTHSLPKGIGQLTACDGRLTVQLRNADVGNKLVLRQGKDRIPFARSKAIGTFPEILKSETRPEIVPTVGAKPEVAINAAPDWTLLGGKTMFLRIGEAQAGNRFEIVFGINDLIDAPSDRLVFTALVATHRLWAHLQLEFRNQEQVVLASAEDWVGPDYPGGQVAAKHKPVRMMLPVPQDAFSCVLVVDVDRIEENPQPPYLFVSNPSLRSTSQVKGPPPFELGGDDVCDVSFEAKINPYATEPLALALGSAKVPLPARPAVSFSDRSFSGRSWYLRCSVPGAYALYIDGAFAGEANLGGENAGVVVPGRFLDGNVHHLTIRDQHGLYVLHEDYRILPAVLTPYDVLQRETRRPVPYQLADQAPFRYRALAEAMRHVESAAQAGLIAHAHTVVSTGFDALMKRDIKPIAFPKHEAPDVSVVIPVHNKFQITYFCLCALLLAQNEATFEVVVVDDGSTDETIDIADLVTGITVVRHDKAQRFIRACNAGVAVSRGRYVALLNNDTEPTVGWIDALIDPFLRFEKVGLTGSKLVYPDGRLQEAGGIVWRSGNPWNYGRGANPWENRFCYTRQVDYVSGAAMLTTRALWDELGGLSDYLEPMYFEDTDFAFKVRDAGYATYLAPASIVFHFEGQTSGTEVTSGMKMHQEINRPKFKKRWASAYREHGDEGQNVDLEKDRGIVGRVAFIDYATPRPDRDAGSYAAVEEMKLVQSLGFKVTFLPDNVAYFGSYTEELQRQGIEVIHAPEYLSVHEFIEKHGSEFDAFYITRYQIAAKFVDLVRKHAPQARVLFLNADLHFLRELRSAIVNKDSGRMNYAATVRDDELAVMRKVDVVLSYNEVEHSVITSHIFDAVKVARAPWVVPIELKVAPLKGREGMSFLGSYSHPPNAEAVEWFASAVMPLLSKGPEDVTFHIYGSAMGDNIKDLESDRIRPHGFVESVAEVYDLHRIFVAPLRSGAGIKGKVLAALAHGIPCILSPVAAEGIGLRNGHDCLIAEEPTEWANAIARLHKDDKLWKTLSKHARDYVVEQFSFERGRELMREAFEAVDIFYTR
ncbi:MULTISPECIES: glycosyltransferase [Alphaproteobacteria]